MTAQVTRPPVQQPDKSAEDMLAGIIAQIDGQLELLEAMEPAYQHVALSNQYKLLPFMDKAREYRRLRVSLDAATRNLKRPPRPIHDVNRPR